MEPPLGVLHQPLFSIKHINRGKTKNILTVKIDITQKEKIKTFKPGNEGGT